MVQYQSAIQHHGDKHAGDRIAKLLTLQKLEIYSVIDLLMRKLGA